MSKPVRRILMILLLSVLALALAAASFVAYLVLKRTSDHRWAERTYRQGPWGERSVWVSEDGDLWMIAEEREDNGSAIRCDVSVYMNTAQGWDEVSFHLKDWDRSVMVGTHERVPDRFPPAVRDEEIFTCALSVKNGRMTPEQFTETGERAFVNGRRRIVLTRYDYETKMAQCPFAYREP